MNDTTFEALSNVFVLLCIVDLALGYVVVIWLWLRSRRRAKLSQKTDVSSTTGDN